MSNHLDKFFKKHIDNSRPKMTQEQFEQIKNSYEKIKKEPPTIIKKDQKTIEFEKRENARIFYHLCKLCQIEITIQECIDMFVNPYQPKN